MDKTLQEMTDRAHALAEQVTVAFCRAVGQGPEGLRASRRPRMQLLLDWQEAAEEAAFAADDAREWAVRDAMDAMRAEAETWLDLEWEVA